MYTAMDDCRFNMHDFKTLEADVSWDGCEGYWNCPTWISPDQWIAPQGESGEYDMIENSCGGKLAANRGWPHLGDNHEWTGIDRNSWSGHITMQKDDEGRMQVGLCEGTGPCDLTTSLPGGVGRYPSSLYDSKACTQGDCTWQLRSDIWNGTSGSAMCHAYDPSFTNACKQTIRNVKIDKGTPWSGKCAALNK